MKTQISHPPSPRFSVRRSAPQRQRFLADPDPATRALFAAERQQPRRPSAHEKTVTIALAGHSKAPARRENSDTNGRPPLFSLRARPSRRQIHLSPVTQPQPVIAPPCARRSPATSSTSRPPWSTSRSRGVTAALANLSKGGPAIRGHGPRHGICSRGNSSERDCTGRGQHADAPAGDPRVSLRGLHPIHRLAEVSENRGTRCCISMRLRSSVGQTLYVDGGAHGRQMVTNPFRVLPSLRFCASSGSSCRWRPLRWGAYGRKLQGSTTCSSSAGCSPLGAWQTPPSPAASATI